MKKLLAISAMSFLLFAAVGIASATTVDLNGSNYIQSGSIFNNSGLTITDFVYSLGTAEDYVATWDAYGSGTASDLFGSSWAQTVTWSGLTIASGTYWSFSGLDIDMITNAAAGSVNNGIFSVNNGILDNDGRYNSLRNASVSVVYSDRSSEFANLIGNAGWQGTHDYILGGGDPVPEPSTILLLGSGLASLAFYRRKKIK